ncbi:hypothetical protein J2T14_003181 [Paenibacillus harenae]|nr:hypothetical protein [Paenibacillus harenae]
MPAITPKKMMLHSSVEEFGSQYFTMRFAAAISAAIVIAQLNQ